MAMTYIMANLLIYKSYGMPHQKHQYFVKRLTNSLMLKIRETAQSDKKRKYFLKRYSNIDNPRFNWLENAYLKYLCKEKKKIEKQQGSQNAKDPGKLLKACKPQCIELLN